METLQERSQKIEDLKMQVEWAVGMVVLRDQVTTHEETISELQGQIDEMKAAKEEASAISQAEFLKLDTKLAAVLGTQQKIKYSANDVSALKTQIADLQEMVDDQNEDRDAGNAERTKEVSGLRETVNELGAEIAELRDEIHGNWKAVGETIKGLLEPPFLSGEHRDGADE